MTTPDERRPRASDPLPGSEGYPAEHPVHREDAGGRLGAGSPAPTAERVDPVGTERTGAEARSDADRTGVDGPVADRPVADRTRTPREDSPAALPPEVPARSGSRVAGIWIALVLGAIVLILLLIFIIQNKGSATFSYFNAEFSLPLGVAMLLAAIAGALVMALVGSVRMIQTALELRKLRKQVAQIRRAAQGR